MNEPTIAMQAMCDDTLFWQLQELTYLALYINWLKSYWFYMKIWLVLEKLSLFGLLIENKAIKTADRFAKWLAADKF